MLSATSSDSINAIGADSHPAGPQRFLSDPDYKIRREAVAKLGNFGATDPGVVPALIGCLHDVDARVRGEAVLALAKIGPDAKRAIGDLDAMARQDRDAKVREYAARALERLR